MSRTLYQDRGGVYRTCAETVHLVRQAVCQGRHAYVLVNNRSEGNEPLTV